MHASAIVQALPTGEIKVCSDPKTGFADMVYTRSNSNTGYYICTFDIKHNDDLKKKRQRGIQSLQIIKKKIIRI